ncbi:MAG: hypothetical protein K2X93_05435 [Candidatus Obscuribacterales bacterium]|nr:hypothetical protein [Candidatus Obscuribacterales bacterium]
MKTMILTAVAACALMFGTASNAQAQYFGVGGGGLYLNNGRGFSLQLGGPQFGYGYNYGYGFNNYGYGFNNYGYGFNNYGYRPYNPYGYNPYNYGPRPYYNPRPYYGPRRW